MDRFGEIERSRENRTDEADGDVEYKLTRVGEVEPLKKVLGRDVKLEVEEAKAEEDDDDSNRGEGERDRSTLVLDFLLEAAAILKKNEEKEMVFVFPKAGSALWFGKPSFTRAMYI